MKIFFTGESCAGKTTLMQGICKKCDAFYMPVFTVTRDPRPDDEQGLFEYVSVEEYETSRSNDEFFFDMSDGKSYYGYKKIHISNCGKHALLYGSPYFVDKAKKIENALLILIESDSSKGFDSRNDLEVIQIARKQVNEHLRESFFSQEEYRKKMNIIFYNEFGDPQLSSELLHTNINTQIADSGLFGIILPLMLVLKKFKSN